MSQWSNWSGSVAARPQALARPKTEAELARLVAAANKVRVAGAGHSFMPLCETEGLLLSLSDMEGALEISADRTRASAPAGWSLARLTAALWEEGLSLINQGDVNPQALAGAIGTGTHGTGEKLGSLSTAARGFHVMGPDGAITQCGASENADLFQAQRIGLGLLGIVTRIEIDVMEAYHLEETLTAMPLDAIAEQWDALTAQNRHVEFWIFPHGGQALLKRLNPAPPEGEMTQTTDVDESDFRLFCNISAAAPWVTRHIQPRLVSKRLNARRVGPTYKVFPSDRTVRFEEMEYEIPRAAGLPALREAMAHIQKKKLPVVFPFEFRVVAADDIWLSPMHAGACASISMHQYSKMEYARVFAAIEPIFRAHGGRPHWAKRHTLTRADVDALYPNAQRFRAVRAARDPHGKFLNAHLAPLFG
ncbi:MAG TPA: D-arabinono-1,4-lactone oxidase [Terricaulis sp.]|nr:D-arabinono-1,4-lactone oxidase [Terricaulis sp.]